MKKIFFTCAALLMITLQSNAKTEEVRKIASQPGTFMCFEFSKYEKGHQLASRADAAEAMNQVCDSTRSFEMYKNSSGYYEFCCVSK